MGEIKNVGGEQGSGGGGAGEANIGANVGTGVGVYRNKTGVTLNFRSILSSGILNATQSTDEIDLFLVNVIENAILSNIDSGLIEGLDATINGGDPTLFDLSAGTCWLVDKYTDPNNPVVRYVTFAGQTGISPAFLGSSFGTNIAIGIDTITGDYTATGQLLQTIGGTVVTPENRRKDFVPLGVVVHLGAQISAINVETNFSYGASQDVKDLSTALGLFNVEGNFLQPNGPNLSLNKTEGVVFGKSIDRELTNPNLPEKPFTAPILLTLSWRDGLGGYTFSPEGVFINSINYDDGTGGALNPNGVIPNNRYVAWRVSYAPSANGWVFEYGQFIYNSVEEAITGIDVDPFEVNPEVLNRRQFIHRGWLITQEGTTDLEADFISGNALFIEQNPFTSGGVSGIGLVNLQVAYNNNPLVTTSLVNGAFTIQQGSGSDDDSVFVVNNGAGTPSTKLRGDGMVIPNNVGRLSIANPEAGLTVYDNNLGSIFTRDQGQQAWRATGAVEIFNNNSGATRVTGDVMVISQAATVSATTTTANFDARCIGPVVDGADNGDNLNIGVNGRWFVKYAGVFAVAIGEFAFSYTTATTAFASTTGTSQFGIVLQSKGVGADTLLLTHVGKFI